MESCHEHERRQVEKWGGRDDAEAVRFGHYRLCSSQFDPQSVDASGLQSPVVGGRIDRYIDAMPLRLPSRLA